MAIFMDFFLQGNIPELLFEHSIQTFYLFKLFSSPTLKGEVFGYKKSFLNCRILTTDTDEDN
ncbi:MAG: hypothetical protein DSO01_05750 [Archaeoglobi archaeon]|nr:MAG: hypothetical protein DSO01_05750 [Archaeoglobi archaeon]TDA26644.1 MAG: hypothetical protein DSN99_05900 [Archaeoglobi archaeon]TDA27695.1 MAG: hypothetical protein DSO00_06410 [Archaeoglobi archaeon]